MSEVPATVFALAGTVFGGVGLEVTRRWLDRAKDKNDTAKSLRDELRGDVKSYREEITTLKAEIDDLENEINTRREQYFDLRAKYITLQGLYDDALRQIQNKTTETIEQARDAGVDRPPVP
jgi:chromosome segregation ATPase